MHKFQLHPTVCNNHNDVEITYDASKYEECPVCALERSDSIELSLTEENDNLCGELSDLQDENAELRDEVESLQSEICELEDKLAKATSDE